jgi:hypothetical protein
MSPPAAGVAVRVRTIAIMTLEPLYAKTEHKKRVN